MPLLDELLTRIERQGPLSLADYMALCLTHPQHGYYMAGDPFGAPRAAGGDFVTAPEISQMFGELIGLWCADTWLRLGSPDPCLLVELGPGRGTLMADALRAARALPGFPEALQIHLVEVSPSLRQQQSAALAPNSAGQKVTWTDSLAELPDGPLLLIANEFFDALPVRQFEQTADGWAERVVVADGDGGLAMALAAPSPLNAALIPPGLRGAPAGSLAELCPQGLSLAAYLGARLAQQGGAALIVDYGPAASTAGATLQALRRHRRHDVLADPGSADLTAHVDFQSLAEAAEAKGALAFGPVEQGVFLQALGIDARAEALAEAAPAKAEEITAARRRLTAPEQMGSLFKALALTAPGLETPAGFPERHPDGGPA
ncbi:class I SAM-dependent methyltransferase [Pelagibius sp.]|uniref:class I SAM-dependent methyltransferase n=1 Tax=Pelagibius sp. TaxID=1931238 RepID=UPI002603D591|nr:SAM-dependent methyltransferase [Pelagibius sp.]